MGPGREGGGDGGLVSEEAMRKLRDTTELDYLTHVVFRMYENKRCAPAHARPRSMCWPFRMC